MSDLNWFDGQDPPDWKKLRSCVHCGLCLPACPTYRELKIETDSPRGRLYLMRALHEGRLALTEEVRGHMDLCLVCRACETACPSGVPFGELMEATRAQIQRREPRTGPGAWAENLAFQHLLPSAGAVGLLAGALRLYQRSGMQALVRGSGLLRLFPRGMDRAEAFLPPVPSQRARRALPRRTAAASPEPRARVAFMVTCVMRPFYPDANRAAALLLAKAGAEVLVPAGGCCGALHAHSGRMDEARDLARTQIDALDALEPLDYVVSNASGCGSSLRDYGHWLKDDPAFAGRARRYSERVRDVTEVLVELGLPKPDSPAGRVVAMHDPCHLAHAQKVRSAPRQLLREAGYEVRDLENSDFCCGSAGIYNLLQPAMADSVLEKKIETVRGAGVREVVVANPGCALHMERGAREAGLDCKMIHPLVLLARAHGISLE